MTIINDIDDEDTQEQKEMLKKYNQMIKKERDHKKG